MMKQWLYNLLLLLLSFLLAPYFDYGESTFSLMIVTLLIFFVLKSLFVSFQSLLKEIF
ncbi:hypothetical protein [Persicobacter diffluens]|uniref:Uncharacterized protein n=1 Tax=Persicobacter diffluens TaxID=981 RepID=A0AAN5AIP6_9BACT|nr:hypothetical protein PEDI_06090 [Persicobacter diffluens]